MLGDGRKVLLADDSAVPHYFEAEAKTVAAPSEEGKVEFERLWARFEILLMSSKNMGTLICKH